MTELDLYKFITDNGIEMRWDDEQLSTWISPFELEEFTKMIESLVSDGGIEARLTTYGYLWIDLVDVCDFYGIDPESIKKK